MNYYQKRMEATNKIEELVETSQSITISKILYIIAKKYGFGTKFVMDCLKNLADQEYIILTKDKATWVEIKSPQEVKDEAEADFMLKEQKHTGPAAREE